MNHPVPPLHRPCACLCPSQAYSPAQRARIIDPGPGRRPPGRRFALHRASGPRLRCAAPSPGPLRPLERGLPLLLRASTRPPRALPRPPPPSQPWPPLGVHFHPSDPSFGRSCLVSALSCVPSARPGKATRPTAAGARAAARAAVAAGAMAAACAQAPPPVWPPEQPVAAAHAPVRASPAALCTSAAAAEQQQEQQQRRRRAQEGASGGLGGGYEACAAGEPREPPAGVVGQRRDGFRRSLRCMPVGFARWKKVVNRTFFGPQPTPRGKPSHSRPEAHFRLSEHKPTSTHNGHVSNVSGKTNAMLDIPRFLYSHARGVEATKRLETRGSGPGEKS